MVCALRFVGWLLLDDFNLMLSVVWLEWCLRFGWYVVWMISVGLDSCCVGGDLVVYVFAGLAGWVFFVFWFAGLWCSSVVGGLGLVLLVLGAGVLVGCGGFWFLFALLFWRFCFAVWLAGVWFPCGLPWWVCGACMVCYLVLWLILRVFFCGLALDICDFCV